MKFDLEEKVNIMISGRHVHLTSEAINKLFGHELHIRNNLIENRYITHLIRTILLIECN